MRRKGDGTEEKSFLYPFFITSVELIHLSGRKPDLEGQNKEPVVISDGKKVTQDDSAQETKRTACLGGPPLEGCTSRQWHVRGKLEKRGSPQMSTQASPGHLGEEERGH